MAGWQMIFWTDNCQDVWMDVQLVVGLRFDLSMDRWMVDE